MSIGVRKAGIDDVETLSALTTEVWLDTYVLEGILPAYAKYVSATFSVRAFEELLASNRTEVLLFHEGDFVLGCVFVTVPEAPLDPAYGTAEIERLYVRRHHQRRGLGTLLLTEALRIAGENGHRSLYLKVHHTNESAFAFYEAHGFKRVGEWIFRVDGIESLNIVLAKPLVA